MFQFNVQLGLIQATLCFLTRWNNFPTGVKKLHFWISCTVMYILVQCTAMYFGTMYCRNCSEIAVHCTLSYNVLRTTISIVLLYSNQLVLSIFVGWHLSLNSVYCLLQSLFESLMSTSMLTWVSNVYNNVDLASILSNVCFSLDLPQNGLFRKNLVCPQRSVDTRHTQERSPHRPGQPLQPPNIFPNLSGGN